MQKPLDKKDITVGMRVQDWYGELGTVKWMGKMEKAQKPPNNDSGTYCAVEMDRATKALNRCNGTWPVGEGGQEYCKSPEGTVVFRKPKDFIKDCSEASIKELREHYGEKIADLSDVQLIKFCIARKFEMAKVKVMIDNDLKWREDFRPGCDEYFEPGMGEDWPVGYSEHLDRDGNLIYVERPGNGGICHPKDFVKKYGVGQICRWHVAGMEQGKQKMAESDYASKRVTAIVDLTKMGDTDSGVRAFAKAIAKIDQDHFPEHLSKMFIVNAPGLFTALWTVIKLFLDDRTKQKVFILGPKESAKVIGEHIDPEHFPPFLGGTDESWLKNNGRLGCDDPSKRIDPENVNGPSESPSTPAAEGEEKKEEKKDEKKDDDKKE